MEHRHVERFLEFLLIGVVMGVAEDLIAVKLATGATIDANIIWIVLLVAIPFAIISELVVDRKDFRVFQRIADRVHR